MKLLLSALCLFAMADTGFSANRLCYGDVMSLQPKIQLKEGSDVVDINVDDVLKDLDLLRNDYNCYQDAADKFCIQASVIAAIASRESRGGRLLNDGYGDHDKAYGIMQCDIHHSGLDCLRCKGNTCCHIEMMTGFLVNLIKKVAKKTNWSPERSLQGGVAAYNFGDSNVRTWENLDIGTTNNDYSNSVITRAKALHILGWN